MRTMIIRFYEPTSCVDCARLFLCANETLYWILINDRENWAKCRYCVRLRERYGIMKQTRYDT